MIYTYITYIRVYNAPTRICAYTEGHVYLLGLVIQSIGTSGCRTE